jgi:SulP family sulfate permease
MLNLFAAQDRNIKNDVLSGVTVALALVPEAVAFAFVAGVSPVIGLYSAFFIGLITAIFGGRPGMISGATGAMAVLVVTLVAVHGIEYLFPAVMLCGVIQILVGAGRLGMLIRMVPHPVVLGFVNGLAIVIFMAQFGSFKTVDAVGQLAYINGPALWIMLALVALTMAIIWLLPKLTRAIPASLAAILVVTGLSVALNRSLSPELAAENQSSVVLTVGDMLLTNAKAAAVRTADLPAASPTESATVAAAQAAMEQVPADAVSLSAGLPRPFFLAYALPPLTLQTLWIILPYAVVLAAVGLIESLMTLTLVDEITETRGSGNRECLGQGLANIICGLFGGMGGCAMIGQSLINVNSGGRGRLSGIVAAVCLLAFVLFLSPWIEMIPMAALVGVMFMVVIGTFEWASLRMARKVPTSDYLVMLLVAGYTAIMHDLATAVILGVIASALVFAWQHAKHIGVDVKYNEFGSKIYQLHGPLFFASTTSFKDLFDPKNDPEDVVIDFYYTRVYDQSGLEAINNLAEKYQHHGKRLHLTHLSPECRQLLDRARQFVEVNLSEDPQYHVATERIINVVTLVPAATSRPQNADLDYAAKA